MDVQGARGVSQLEHEVALLGLKEPHGAGQSQFKGLPFFGSRA